MLGLIRVVSVAIDSQSKVEGEKSAYGHCGYLEADAGNHDVITNIDERDGFGSGNTTTSGLQEDAEGVAADEDPSVEMRLELRIFRSVVEDQMLEGEVDAGGQEGWTQNQAHNLYLESCLRPWIVMHDDSAAVADTFSGTAKGNCKCVGA